MRRGRTECGRLLLGVVLSAFPALPFLAQPAPGWPMQTVGNSVAGDQSQPAIGPVFRKIDDPAAGGCWLLARNTMHPEGPGKLVRVAGQDRDCDRGSGSRSLRQQRQSSRLPFRVVIHPGDRLLVEQHSLLVNAQFEATAIEPAVPGERFGARLRVNGKVVTVVAVRAGLAEMTADFGAQR